MTTALLELAKVIAYGGLGCLLGYLGGVRAADRHRLTTEILDEAEVDVPGKRRLLGRDAVQTVVVVAVMLAMLLTGISWMQSDQDNAEQDQRDCRQAAETAKTLRERTANYLEKARADLQWKLEIRNAMVQLGAEPDSPFLAATRESIAKDREYVDHLKENPYPKGGTC